MPSRRRARTAGTPPRRPRGSVRRMRSTGAWIRWDSLYSLGGAQRCSCGSAASPKPANGQRRTTPSASVLAGMTTLPDAGTPPALPIAEPAARMDSFPPPAAESCGRVLGRRSQPQLLAWRGRGRGGSRAPAGGSDDRQPAGQGDGRDSQIWFVQPPPLTLKPGAQRPISFGGRVVEWKDHLCPQDDLANLF